MNPKVSVIVPVYNVEKTLNRCMQSITGQSYENMEIVLVDDGSTDHSGEICEEWKNKDNRVIVVHKKNAGLGEARNSGIAAATGKYICFCDSDDFLNNNAVQICVEYAERYHTDIIHFGFVLLSENLKEKEIIKATKEYLFQGNEVRDIFIPGMLGEPQNAGQPFGVWLSLCGSFISLDIIRKSNWKCKSERVIISEDTYSLLELYSYIDIAGIIPFALYNYVENPKSLSRTFKADRYPQIEKFYYLTKARCKELGYGEKCIERLSSLYIDFTIAAIKQLVSADCSFYQKRQTIKKIQDSVLLQKLFREEHEYRITKRILMFCMLRKKTLGTYLLCRLRNIIS